MAEQSLAAAGFTTCRFSYPAGEGSKHIGTLSDMLEFLAEQEITRQDIIIALGGGVAGDMAGFAAAVYQRGIRFVQVPTTFRGLRADSHHASGGGGFLCRRQNSH